MWEQRIKVGCLVEQQDSASEANLANNVYASVSVDFNERADPYDEGYNLRVWYSTPHKTLSHEDWSSMH